MHTIAQLLDAARQHSDIPSDNQLAPAVGVTRAAISQWRNGVNVPRDEHAATLAKLSGLETGYVLLCIYAATTEHDDVRRVIRQIAGHFKQTAAVITLAIAGILGVSHAPPAHAAAQDGAVHSILCHVRDGVALR